MRIKSRWIVVLVVSLLLVLGAPSRVVMADAPCSVRVNNTFDKLLASASPWKVCVSTRQRFRPSPMRTAAPAQPASRVTTAALPMSWNE